MTDHQPFFQNVDRISSTEFKAFLAINYADVILRTKADQIQSTPKNPHLGKVRVGVPFDSYLWAILNFFC